MAEKVAGIAEQARNLDVISEIFARLQKELPADLRYHTVQHSDEVLHEVIRLAVADDLSNEEIQLLAIAAAYHDAGFIIQRRDNEVVGAQIAEKALRNHGYNENEITEVREAILSTQLKPIADGLTVAQIPSTSLARYLLDADVANFGKQEFFDKALLVYTEITAENPARLDDLLRNKEGREFLKGTKTMVEHHQWYTNAAKESLESQKQKNLATLEGMLKVEI